MKPKNIAVLMTALDSGEQTEALRGIEEYGKEQGYNISVFLWFAGSLEKEKQKLGEVNIVTLPDLNLFDGVIVFADVFHTDTGKQVVGTVLEDLDKPVVTIGCKRDNYPSVCTDCYTAMRQVVEHYVVDHNMKRIHFVKGVEGNPDGDARYQAYVDVLTEHGIPIIPERVTKGDFYVTGGELAVQEILSFDIELPEAIICANDIMAITVCDALMRKGYRVPEDVVISGYDFSIESQEHVPGITTVRVPFYERSRKACEILINEINGEVLPEDENSILFPDEVVLGESCGCRGRQEIAENLPKSYSITEVMQRKLIFQMIVLEKHIMECDGIDGWLKCVETFIAHVDPAEFYWCVNEDFEETVFEMDIMEQEGMDIAEKMAYTYDVRVLMAYKNGIFRKKPGFKSRLALDVLFDDTEKPKTYIFSPLHYLENNFGYMVFVDSTFPLGNPLYISWLIKMGNSVENIRKQSMLKNAMARLDEMYIKDSLTGALNRFGMERCFGDIKKKCMMSRAMMQLSFIDLDGLKNINDKYGHEEGDRIINAASVILKKATSKFKVIRYGGDEFIVMGTVRDEKEVVTYWEKVQKEIDHYNLKMEKEAKLSLSFGYEIFRMDAKTSLETCIGICDMKMYEAKRSKNKINK